ncbi:hypothetical protein ACLMNJ_19080 [Streptomyces seoulensis]
MSTTSTSAEEPRRRRRPARRLPFIGGTARQGDAARRTPARGAVRRRGRVRGPLVLDDRAGLALLRMARKRGGRAARRGALDPWVLGSGDRVPYFAELASVRNAHVHRVEEELNGAEEAARLADAQTASEVTAGRTEITVLTERIREAQQEVTTARGQLDLLAVRSARWLRFRDSLREQVEERWLRARFPDAAQPPAAPPPAAGEPGAAGPDGPGDGSGPDAVKAPRAEPEGDDWQSVQLTDAAPEGGGAPPVGLDELHRAARAGVRDQPSAHAWEGLQTRPGLPRWMTWALLLVIMAVEMPVYWVAYQPFHGVGSTGGDLMSGTLAVSTAVVMLILPHLAGLMLRWRSATGSPRRGWLPSLSLLGVWGFLTWLLGSLRAKFVTQHDTPAPATGGTGGFRGLGGTAGDTSTLVDRLHLTTQTVTWLFCALLLLSGGVGFLLGLFREHPFLDAYRTALENRTGLLRRRAETVAATEAAQARQSTAQARQEDRREAADARIAATRQIYEAAAHAYLDGVMGAAKDPAVTESAMRLSQNWPLLPSAARRESVRER